MRSVVIQTQKLEIPPANLLNEIDQHESGIVAAFKLCVASLLDQELAPLVTFRAELACLIIQVGLYFVIELENCVFIFELLKVKVSDFAIVQVNQTH